MMNVTLIQEQQPTSVLTKRRLHRAWWVAVVAFVAIIGAAGFRATPGVLITPLQDEFGCRAARSRPRCR